MTEDDLPGWKPQYERFSAEPTLAYDWGTQKWVIVTDEGIVALDDILGPERGELH